MELNLENSVQVWLGLYERETHEFVTRMTRSIASAVDVGAAQGEFSIFFLRRTPARCVIAFDPDPEFADRFSVNLRLNGLIEDGRLLRLAKFVGSERGQDHCTLDDIAAQLASPIFIKVDVDGAEMEVLAGAHDILRSSPRVRLLIETHSPQLEQDCLHLLQELGFVVRIIKNAWWRGFIRDQRPISHNRWLVAAKRPDMILD